MFCPKCGDEFQEGFTVCPDCKLDLVDVLPPAASEVEEEFVTVATFENEFEAAVAKGALEAKGIPAIAPADSIGSFSRVGYRGFAELKVRVPDRDLAVALLKEMGHR